MIFINLIKIKTYDLTKVILKKTGNVKKLALFQTINLTYNAG